jgi:(p)ppGpp synthase/HD superfamily hydrolase
MKLSSRFTDALVYAAELHQDQQRKGPDAAPYISHLMLVAGTVLDCGGSEVQAIAGLLHDSVEDQGGERTREVVRRKFGPEVAAIVDACTDTVDVPKPPWRARKEAFVESLASAPDEALLVILADKLANITSTIRDLRNLDEPPETYWRLFKGGRGGTLWYYRAIRDGVKREDPHVRSLGERFDLAVEELEEMAGRT